MPVDVPIQVDVAIVGAGITGLSTAAAIMKACPNLTVALIDKRLDFTEASVEPYDARVYSVSHRSADFFDDLKIWPEIRKKRYCPYQDMVVWDGEGNGSICFDHHLIDKPALGYIVENRVLQSALLNALESSKTLQTFNGYLIDDIQYNEKAALSTLTLLDHNKKSHTLKTSLLIGADGSQSVVREQLGFSVRAWSYNQSAIVATVKTSQAHNNTAWQRFTRRGPIAFLPLADEDQACCYSSLVWSVDNSDVSAIEQLEDQAFCDLLTREFEGRLGEVISVSKRHVFSLNQSHVHKYFKSGAVLVGDAAHSIHPLAGQGANLGIYDAACLAAEIQWAVERSIPLHHKLILKRYERKRQPENLAVMLAMESFKRLFGREDLAVLFLRNQGLSMIDRSRFIKHIIARAVS